jgi:soluble cytochrome b562
MTEYNIFCYSTSYNDENSFQQKRYRAFNKQLTKDRYDEICRMVKGILPRQETLLLEDYWKTVTQQQWCQLLDIPEAKDFKEGFEYISGVKIDEIKKETIKIGELEFNKAEVEERLKDLKPVN